MARVIAVAQRLEPFVPKSIRHRGGRGATAGTKYALPHLPDEDLVLGTWSLICPMMEPVLSANWGAVEY